MHEFHSLRLGVRALAALGFGWVVGFAGPAQLSDATSCYQHACGACTPPAPAAVSTLISGFPAGATIPIVFVDPADNLKHRFVATQLGAILVWDGGSGALLATPFLDLRSDGGGPGLDKVGFGGERGLLAMAVEPDYITSGRFYVYYTRSSDGDIVVERYQGPARGFPR